MSYLNDTRYATEALFDLIAAGTDKLQTDQKNLLHLQKKFAALEWHYRSAEQSDDFNEVQVMAAGAHASRTYQEITALKSEISQAEAAIADRDFARQALAGAVLQIARQGIASRFCGYEDAPKFRWFGTVHLAELIWEARNQAMHFDRSPHNHVKRVFGALQQAKLVDFGVSEPPYQNRALAILNILGWIKHEDYERDMAQLLAP